MLRRLANQFTERLEDSRKAKNPVAKEQRQFEVAVQPSILTLVRAYWTREFVKSDEGISEYNGYLHYGYGGLPPSSVVNHYLAGFYSQVDDGRGQPLKVKLPMKSRPLDFNEDGCSVREVWQRLLREDYVERGIAADLPGLLERLGYQELARVASVQWPQQAFFRDLAQLVSESDGRPLAPSVEWDTFVSKYPRPSDLEMKTRVYFSRGDERAFVVDSSLVRPLVGSIIQAIIQPAHVPTRRCLPTDSVMPAVMKNIVDKTVRGDVGSDVVVTVSDTSSFTSSAVNAWAGLLAMLLVVTGSPRLKHLTEPFNVAIGDQALTVTLVQILQLYLFMTVGVACSVEETGDEYVAQGGYLGVCANINATLLAQNIHLQDLQSQLKKENDVVFLPQSGGDDIFAVYTGAPSAVEESVGRARVSLTRFVGFQKEFRSVNLGALPLGTHPLGLAFCQKDLLVDVWEAGVGAGRMYRIYSRIDLPVLEALVDTTTPSEAILAQRFTSYLASVREYSRKLALPGHALSEFAEIFVELRGALDATDGLRSRAIYMANEADLVDDSGTWFTKAAYDAVLRVPSKRTILRDVFNTVDEKARVLRVQDRLRKRVVEVGNLVLEVWTLRVDRCVAVRVPAVRGVFPRSTRTSEDFEYFRRTLYQIRAELGAYEEVIEEEEV